MRVLGISVWIYFIWIFIVGVLLFFYTVHGTLFEEFVVTTPVGASSLELGSFVPSPFVEYYNINTQTWDSLDTVSDRLLYFQKLSIGSELVSLNGSYALLFKTDGTLVLYNKVSLQILWTYATGNKSQYLYHNGDIFVINTDNTYGNSPFIPPADSTALASISALIGSWSASSAGLTAGSLTTSYLQVLDNANLVLYSSDGTILFETNTAIPQVLAECRDPVNTTYPFTQSDCPTLITNRTTILQDIQTYTQSANSVQLSSAKSSLCTIQHYYDTLSCATYSGDMTIKSLTPTAINTPVTLPNTNIKGSLVQGSNEITVTGDLTASIRSGDMIYLGYGTDMNGPFIVSSIIASTITITKHYVGVNITNAIISVSKILLPTNSINGNTIPIINTPPITFQSKAMITAQIYPTEPYINISSSSPNSLPNDIGIGDILLVKQDFCNIYDIDNNDGTCTTYICNTGEVDLLNGRCQPFTCNIGDSDNGEGTCTTPLLISGKCNDYASELCSVNPQAAGCVVSAPVLPVNNMCTVKYKDNLEYSYAPAVNDFSRRYTKTEGGTGGISYVKSSSNKSYKYSKTLGPFIIAMRPTANKIMIKSFQSSDLDSNGVFKLSPMAQWRKNVIFWIKNNTLNISPPSKDVTYNTQLAAVPTTDDLRALPENGLRNAKIYRAAYNDGVNLMTYTAISPGNTDTVAQSSYDSIILQMSTSSNGMINITGVNLIIGQKYIVTISVRARTTSSGASDGTCILYAMYSSTNTYNPEGVNIQINTTVGVTLSSGFKLFTWKFVALSSNLRFKVITNMFSNIEIEFNRLSIQGGIIGPTAYLGCTSGSTTTAGLTTCN